MDEAHDPRAQGGDRLRARRRARAVLQDPRAREAHPEAALRAVGGAGDADAVGVRRVPPVARQLVGLPVGAVSRDRVPARQQARRRARGVPARSRDVRRARRAACVRRRCTTSSCAISRGAGLPVPQACLDARLHAAVRAQSGSRAGVQDDLREPAGSGGTRTTCARSWSTWRRASSSGASAT